MALKRVVDTGILSMWFDCSYLSVCIGEVHYNWFASIFRLYQMVRILKRSPLMSVVNSFLVDSPLPSNINYWYNAGSILGLCLIIQIVSGIILAMFYTSDISLAFESVEYIVRDVNRG
jgi:quinol-cytochrome oxidoreductase complex cytochrome b subunit